MMMSKVAFYTLITYFAASMGTLTLATHQVMVQTFLMCSVWGGPLSQTAQSFMPEFLYGLKWSLAKVAFYTHYIFCYVDGNTHLGCSSLTVQHNFVNLKVEDLQKNEWCSSKFISFNQNLNPTSFLVLL
ncbi:protein DETOXIFICATION 46, chloroplastic-like [Pistacia vera]|uniref:protein DETOXIFICATION 46, chloroplastic-like n=1 Tax=Pistacia vera TaxID=55513 RepID=UPI001262FBC1|nr:protein DETOXIFICATION 46, chloroplastic-like [Pistacia vera]